jgi:hypothetical protein
MQSKTVIDTLDFLVRALCADYKRREEIIIKREAERRIDNELRYLNFKIFDAAAEVVGERRADIFISEIGASVGYANSDVDCMSEGMYKSYKRHVKNNIAKRLYLK